MSAFIVCTDHIDYLITAACEAGIGGTSISWDERSQSGDVERIAYTNADRIGAALLAANIASVAYRYGDDRDDLPGPVPNPTPEAYRLQAVSGDLPPVQVLKALDCYEYQCCERPDWLGSPAWRFVDALRGRMIGHLPGYDAALWEISRSELAKRRTSPAPSGPPAVWTLHRLPDGSGVVVARDRAGKVIGGQAGFSVGDVSDALALADDGAMTFLRDWQHLTLTPGAAAYVAATYLALSDE